MKSKRNLSILIGLILILILGFGIKAVNSDSSNDKNEIAFSESSSFSSLSNTKEKYIIKDDKKKTSSKTAVKESDKKESKDSSKSSLEESNSSSTSKEKKPLNKESEKTEKNNISIKNKDNANEESIKSDLDHSSSKSSQTPKKENKPSEKPVQPTPPKVEEEVEEMTSPVETPVTPVETPEAPVEKPEEIPEVVIPVETVTIYVTSDPSVKGTILNNTAVEYSEGDTALDVTLRIFKQNGIQFEIAGSGSSAYMRGIANLYEFDKGELSGWHIRVNGKMIDRSAGAYTVEPGDSVNWNYTTNYLEDSGDW